MQALFQSSYYWMDLLIGYGTPLLVFWLYRSDHIDRFVEEDAVVFSGVMATTSL